MLPASALHQDLRQHVGAHGVDPATNQRVLLHRLHRLFWIRMEYWSLPVVLAAFVPLLALRTL